MRVYIHPTQSFKLGQFLKRTDILKAKIDYLKHYNFSDVMIESLLYANGYSLREINCFLSSFTATFKYNIQTNTMQLI